MAGIIVTDRLTGVATVALVKVHHDRLVVFKFIDLAGAGIHTFAAAGTVVIS